MRIPENKVQEILDSANIVDVISEYVQLRKRGKNYLGLCPFHNEKTPSFTVSDEKQIFHCFGCHAGGNVYKFLMDYQKISFIESVQELADKLGISLEVEQEYQSTGQSEQEILYDINTAAGKYFSDNLLNSIEAEFARSYFESRKIKLKTIREFGLGYAFPNRDRFIEFAQSKGIDINRALSLGIIGKYSDGKLYDRFAGRIIFPIFSPNGRVVAFAGRILENKQDIAKYVNSPESSVYTKGRILYGLSHAKDEIRRLDKAILVEGYMDLISLYQSGVKNVVAVSGTALTDDQAQLLSRYTKNVVLLFDADTAGIKASMRSIEILLRKDMEIKIASLPSGEDPDSFVNNFGREKFEDLVKQAQNFLEYQSAYYESQGMFSDPAKLTEAIRDLVKPVALINDELKRSLLLKSISKKFNLREKLIESELEKALLKNLKQTPQTKEARPDRAITGQSGTETYNKKDVKSLKFYNERSLIKLLFEGQRQICESIFNSILPEDFIYEPHQKIAEIVFNSYNNNEELNPDSLIMKIEDNLLQNYLRELLIEKDNVSKDTGSSAESDSKLISTMDDTIKLFKLKKLKRELESNHTYLETAVDSDEKKEILHNIKELSSEMHGLIGQSNRNFIDLNFRK